MFVGLGNNSLTEKEVDKLAKRCPELRCVDLAYNSLCDIEQTLKGLKQLSLLKVLSLHGNPISMLKHYYKVTTS